MMSTNSFKAHGFRTDGISVRSYRAECAALQRIAEQYPWRMLKKVFARMCSEMLIDRYDNQMRIYNHLRTISFAGEYLSMSALGQVSRMSIDAMPLLTNSEIIEVAAAAKWRLAHVV
jgi:hypothetical protein